MELSASGAELKNILLGCGSSQFTFQLP